MKLTSNLRLEFAKRPNTITVITRTYEKASFDQFLAASIAEHAGGVRKAESYIDSVTGKGSMNPHLKKLVQEMLEDKTSEERRKILESSLYPIEKIDDSQSFVYYPEFGVSLFDGQLYEGDLQRQEDALRKIVRFDGELVSIRVHKGDESRVADNYRVIINENKAYIEVAPKAHLVADADVFTKMVVQKISTPSLFEDIEMSPVEGEGWYLLTNSQINGPMKSDFGFIDNRQYYLITTSGIQKTEVGVAFGLYLYRNTLIPFTPEHASLCTSASRYLLNSRLINNFKTSALVELLSSSLGETAQKCINFVLSVKDSRELSELAMKLMLQGMQKGWDEGSLKQMKRIANPKQLEAIYKISPNLFELKDCINMDSSVLTSEHLSLVQEYRKQRQSKIDYIKMVNGEIASSAIREKSKRLKNDEEVAEFRRLINKLMAHSQVDVMDLDEDALNSRFRLAKRLYEMVPSINAKIVEQGVDKHE